jgi:hypothetical protein
MGALNDSLEAKAQSEPEAGPSDECRAHRLEAAACNAAPLVRVLMAEIGVISDAKRKIVDLHVVICRTLNDLPGRTAARRVRQQLAATISLRRAG